MSLPHVAPYQLPTEAGLPSNMLQWTVQPQRAVLLVHDMQRYFVNVFKPDTEPIRTVVPNIARLCQTARAHGVPIVFSAQPGDQSPQDRGLLLDLWGPGIRAVPEHEEVIAELTPNATDVRLTTWRYSTFQRTRLRAMLAEWGRDQLIVSGVYAHLGCLLTAGEAFMQDVRPFLVADAVADFSLVEHMMALRFTALRCGVVLSTDRLVEQLSGSRPEGDLMAEGKATGELSLDRIRADVAETLGVPQDEISDDDDLIGCGLDSIRIMHLVEKWQALGTNTTFIQLAEAPTISNWHRLLSGPCR